MTLTFISLFIVFIIIGPIYWWIRNYYRISLKRECDFVNRTLKWVWPVSTFIGLIFGFLAILCGTLI